MRLIRTNYGKVFANPDELSAKLKSEQDLYDILKY